MKNKLILLLITTSTVVASCETKCVVNSLDHIEYESDSTFVYEIKYKSGDDSVTDLHYSRVELSKGTIIYD